MATTKPNVNINPVANRYATAGVERIIEFNSGDMDLGRPGGLMSLRRREDGSLSIQLYRLDPHVSVDVAGHKLIADGAAESRHAMLELADALGLDGQQVLRSALERSIAEPTRSTAFVSLMALADAVRARTAAA